MGSKLGPKGSRFNTDVSTEQEQKLRRCTRQTVQWCRKRTLKRTEETRVLSLQLRWACLRKCDRRIIASSQNVIWSKLSRK